MVAKLRVVHHHEVSADANRIGVDIEDHPALRHVAVDVIHGLRKIVRPAAAIIVLCAQLGQVPDHIVERVPVVEEVTRGVDADLDHALQALGIHVDIGLRHARSVALAEEVDPLVPEPFAGRFKILDHLGHRVTREVNARLLVTVCALLYSGSHVLTRLVAEQVDADVSLHAAAEFGALQHHRAVLAAVSDHHRVAVLEQPGGRCPRKVGSAGAADHPKHRLSHRGPGSRDAHDGQRDQARARLVPVLRDDQRAALGFIDRVAARCLECAGLDVDQITGLGARGHRRDGRSRGGGGLAGCQDEAAEDDDRENDG